METISIAIGDAHSSTCIVLPRSHELVRQIESLLPPSHNPVGVSPEPQHQYPQDARQFYPSSAPLPPAPQMDMTLPSHAPVPVPGRPTLSAFPTDQQPHRSAALIQSLLHRPTANETTTAPIQATYRRGRMATAAQGSTKRCRVPGCGKISVSRGVCRGHGGGRRCQFEGCSKSAQSRGDYCWSHGGGHRCEVPGCMRSRKSKRFCRSHVNWGSASPAAREKISRPALLPRAEPAPVAVTPPPHPPAFNQSPTRLPSLHQALQSHHVMLYGTGSHAAMGRPAFPTMTLASSISC